MPAHDPFAPSSSVKLTPTGEPVEAKEAAPVADPAPESPVLTTDAEVPKGTVRELEEWVGDDKARAQAVLDSENESGEPRKSLVKAMEDLLAAE